MEKIYDLKEKLCEELEEYARKQDMGAGDLEVIHKLTDTIKNIDKICMLEEEGGYSEEGSYGGGSYGDGGSYGRGSSYANRGKHYVRGHYSRDGGNGGGGGSMGGGQGGYSSRRGGRGGYSRNGGYSQDDGRSEMMEHLEMAMDAATDEDRETIKRFMRKLENA